MFNKDIFLLNIEDNKAEREHLLHVVGIAVGKILASRRPEAKKLACFLPAHHEHQNSNRKLTPALTFIIKPYPYQEMKNPDTIKLMIRIQRKYLQSVARSLGDDPKFLHLLKLLEDPDADTDEREMAEEEVKTAVMVFGEWVGHGDLLTVKMIQEARMLMVGSATAFGRLEFLGPFRLQMLHMKMKKICQDYSECMRHDINFDDKLSLPWLTSLTRMKVTNKAKEIKKNDSSFERHDQFLAEVQISYLVNMFDNYIKKTECKNKLESVADCETAVIFVLGMLEDFNIQLFWDPTKNGKSPDEAVVTETEDTGMTETEDTGVIETADTGVTETEEGEVTEMEETGVTETEEGGVTETEEAGVTETEEAVVSEVEDVPEKKEDDMFIYCRDMVTRLCLSLVFDICEEEGDAEGLRALRRIMVGYFLAKKPERMDSKYASFTVIDMVVELSASERTRKRMDLYVVINPSGTRGGGLFRDKHMEHCVRSVKGCLRGKHGGIDDIQLQKEVGGLSVMTEIVEHNRRSVMRSRLGKEHAKDMVGDVVRDQLEENVAKYDPFNRDRETKHVFYDKSKGGPFVGLTEANLDKFLKNKKKEYNSKYQ